MSTTVNAPAQDRDEDLNSLDIKRSQQMDLFTQFDLPSGRKRDYSNTVDIYDAIPKYVWGKTREHEDLKSASITRHCTIRGERITVKLKPALIDKGDRTVLIYPGQREELVEDALRKIAVNGQGIYVNDKAGVSFTLYELMKELERMGHTYSLAEIKEALFVCRGSIIECYSEDGESVINSSLFGLLGLTTRKDLQKDRKGAKCYVQFNPLVNESIMNLTFRQYNYQVGMDIRSPLARFFYKRMCQYWTQASEKHPYTPTLIAFLDQSPRGLTSKMGENLRAMRGALDTLKKHKVIERYEEEKVLKGKQKVIDARFTIYPHTDFVKEVIKANQRNKVLKTRIIREGLEFTDIKGIKSK
ncbi:plasmid replication protein [Marinobacterium aestuariivivens]|uniref:Plasmid replication protein n=1 Tax=Marinobacterium aestuariivivens TaxID=1698799 RepID=A0ABW2A9H7_9GAMM